MDLATAAQIASSISNVVLILVFGYGYYKQYEVSQRTLQEMQESRVTEGRPQVLVYADYSRLPEVDLVVMNTGNGPAKSLSFDFSEPLVSPDGFVISDMRYLQEGTEALAPKSGIACQWGDLDGIISQMKEQNQTDGIAVRVNYQDIVGKQYRSEWNVNPTLYEGNRDVTSRDMVALVDTMEGVSDTLNRISANLEGVGDRFGRHEEARAEPLDEPPKGSHEERANEEGDPQERDAQEGAPQEEVSESPAANDGDEPIRKRRVK